MSVMVSYGSQFEKKEEEENRMAEVILWPTGSVNACSETLHLQ